MKTSLPSLNALYAFNTAAYYGSFTQAAQALNVTQGAVNRQVHLLEQQLGVVLFVKQGRGVRLTDAGQILYETTREVFEHLHQGCTQVQQQQDSQPLVLGCSGSLLARWFIPRLDQLNQALPEVRLQLHAAQGELEQLDALLCFSEAPWPQGVQVFELASEWIGPVVSPLYPAYAQLAQGCPDVLKNEPLLYTQSRPQAWPYWATAQGLTAQDLHWGQGFEHLYYLLEAALAGLGVAIAPKLLVENDLACGRLKAPWGFMETSARLTLWVPQPQSDPRISRLLHWLSQQLNPTPVMQP